MESLKQAALEYARRGWPVFPCHTARNGVCSCGVAEAEHAPGFGKHPRTPHGWQDATTDPATIEAWWQRWPDANIGVATGPAGLVVVDVDVKDGAPGLDSWADLRRDLALDAETATCETPTGGLHVYYRANGTPIGCSTSKLGPALDVRANGGYVLAPPSVHPSGGVYGWAYGYDPLECALLEIPAALAERLAEPKHKESRPIPERAPQETLAELRKAAAALERLDPARADNYDSWLEVGMALSELGPAGLELWESWSAQSPKWQPGVCAEKWATFAPGQGVTLATLYHLAAQDTGVEGEPTYHLTDLGNAERLITAHGDDLRWCEPLGGWIVWDGSRWAADATGEAERRAQDVARNLYAEAQACEDSAERKRIAKHALATESAARRRAMLDQAWPLAAVRPELFDVDPWLLNCANGILDLRTGQLAPHRRDAYLTKLAPVNFDPDAADPLFDRYLEDTTGGDADFAAYLQRAAGYTLTGLTDEESVFLVLGPGATGKSTLVEALLAALGDYAYKASFETFLAQRHNGGPRPDLVAMRGARLVAAVESPQGRRLAEAEVKDLSGGDSLTARDLYRSPVTFRPTFKLWLATNHAPTMDDQDTALWRRIKRLPFEHVVAEDARDPELKRHLSDPQGGGPAVLAWAVKGCLAWQRQGLGACARVREATADLRAEFDPIAEFLETCCIVDAKAEASARDLRKAYEAWAEGVGAKPINNKEWGKRLQALGCESIRKRLGDSRPQYWTGIGLLTEGDDDAQWTGWTEQKANSVKSPIGGGLEKVYKKGRLSRPSRPDAEGYYADLADGDGPELPGW